MLSFFLKKRQNSDTPHEEMPRSHSDLEHNNGADEFIFIEKKISDPVPRPSSHPIYPSMPSVFSGAYPPQISQSTTINTNQPVVPYVQDVPFVLAPQLRIKNTSDITQIQVDAVLALLTRQMSLDEKDDYNFTLEKSIRNECY